MPATPCVRHSSIPGYIGFVGYVGCGPPLKRPSMSGMLGYCTLQIPVPGICPAQTIFAHFVSSAIVFSRLMSWNLCPSHSRLTFSQYKSDFFISRLGAQFRLILVSSRVISFQDLSCLVSLDTQRVVKSPAYCGVEAAANEWRKGKL